MATVIDVHSHAWKYPTHFGEGFRRQASRARAGVEVDLTVGLDDYRRTCPPGTRTIAFGGKARLSELWVDDAHVATYVAQDPEHLIGFLSVDPTQRGWKGEMRAGHEELGLRGIKLLPMYAGFRPDDERLDPLWRYATRRRLPVLLHTGTTFVSQAPLECTLPRHDLKVHLVDSIEEVLELALTPVDTAYDVTRDQRRWHLRPN
jgi:hypothetical protein